MRTHIQRREGQGAGQRAAPERRRGSTEGQRGKHHADHHRGQIGPRGKNRRPAARTDKSNSGGGSTAAGTERGLGRGGRVADGLFGIARCRQKH